MPSSNNAADPGFVTLVNKATGAVIRSIKLDGTAGHPNVVYFEAARFQVGGPVLGVIDGSTETFIQNLAITSNDHSVAVDPVTGEVFVAFGAAASNAFCTQGCIGVFAPVNPVPEPASVAMIAAGLVGLAGRGRARKPSRG